MMSWGVITRFENQTAAKPSRQTEREHPVTPPVHKATADMTRSSTTKDMANE